ncbi:hypothetical protein M4D51_08070 [Microbacterium sp. p3-SID338]|uniref:hypothetical protein n=1 Tax=Microbacterium sp. p3-SID338 TaxID=2916214 RepID=UPI0021A7D6BC|nr:hypothetical protein [Microbacterium sp. p3-SID338]MCT1395681.1 hypothetical protein [Microbacterium sp. p3-SID338]
MGEELPPSLFNILRGDLRDTRSEINGRLDGLARDMVTSAMLAQVQANQKERDDRQDARIRSLEQADAEREKEARRIAEEQRKTRAQQFFSIGLAAFGVLGSIISAIVVWSVTSGLQQLAGG